MARYVTLSKEVTTRDWYCNVKHLWGKKLEVVAVQGEYIVFLPKDGNILRRWHKSNLRFIENKLVLENK